MTNPKHGRHPPAKSRNPFTCGLTGKTFTIAEASNRREALARTLGKRLGWLPNDETEWDKVACIFAFNTVCTPARVCDNGRAPRNMARGSCCRA